MKTPMLYYGLLFLVLTNGLMSCTTEGPSHSPAVESKILKDNNSYEIGRDTALLAIRTYDRYIDSVIVNLGQSPQTYPAPGEKLIYGVQVDRDELYQVLEARPMDDLYVMIGTKSDGETEFFFSFKSTPNLDNNNLLDNWDFFDFTRPCPNACPDFVVSY